MATPGLIEIWDKDDKKAGPVLLYAFNDGYTSNAVKALARLPFLIFDAAKHVAPMQNGSPETYEGQASSGHWFYSIFASRRLGYSKSDAAFEEFSDNWKRHASFQMEPMAIGLANHLVWSRFNWWHVVRGKQDMSYPDEKPCCVVTCDRDAGEYTVRVPGTKAELEYDAKSFGIMTDKLNARLLNKDARIEVKPARGGFTFRVPSVAILMALTWQDIGGWRKAAAKTPAGKKTKGKK